MMSKNAEQDAGSDDTPRCKSNSITPLCRSLLLIFVPPPSTLCLSEISLTITTHPHAISSPSSAKPGLIYPCVYFQAPKATAPATRIAASSPIPILAAWSRAELALVVGDEFLGVGSLCCWE